MFAAFLRDAATEQRRMENRSPFGLSTPTSLGDPIEPLRLYEFVREYNTVAGGGDIGQVIPPRIA
jgi:hypothetical protein